MHDTKFWRLVAVSLIVAIIYVGHGLHNGTRDGFPSLTNAAQAGGVAVQETGGTPNIYTTNGAGTQLYLWRGDGTGKATCIGVANFDGPFRERIHDMGRATVPSEGPRMAPEQIRFQGPQPLPGRAPDPAPAPVK
ncbi:MAG TPA: hypothetical protein VGP63_26485 [Planctomycetaceae bacterium]|jgi:hypothetical protein|nr:hypothetical protein [Planctomycetaceae bacterium]